MAQINLAPDIKKQATARSRRRGLLTLTILLVVISLIAFGGLYFWTSSLQSQASQLDQSLSAIETEVARAQSDVERVRLFEGRLQAIEDLTQSYDPILSFLTNLEQLLPPATVLSRLELNRDSNEVLLAGNTPSIDDISVTLASLIDSKDRETPFRDVTIENVVEEQESDGEGNIISITFAFTARLTLATN